jgi:CBS domain-containing protein
MKVKDVMTQRVISIQSNASILQAARLMLQNRISGLPVVDSGGNLVGIVTEGDFLRRSETATERNHPRWLQFLLGSGRLAEEYVHSHGRKVDEVMTRDPRTVVEGTPLEDVVQAMEKHHIKRLPVVRDRQLVGIVSRANLLHALASIARDIKPGTTGDDQIRARLLKELDQQKWAPSALVNVVVRNGVVELCGSITDERQRTALKVMAENVPGVKRVRDHLAWVDPMSGTLLLSPDDEKKQAVAP